MSEVKVNKISPRTACGTTTLGDSGDTFTIPAGVTITNSGTASGFGSTGEISWDTTVKTTGTFTATAGIGYFLNTSGGTITVNFPAGAAGSSLAFADYADNWQNNKVTISPNGTDKIGGVNSNVDLTTQGQAVQFVYVDGTQGWINVIDSTSNVRAATYVTATGGCITTCGDYKMHKFNSPGTFCVSAGAGPLAVVDYMVVAGGGGGSANDVGSGGGAGGFRESPGTASGCYTTSPLGSPGTSLSVSINPYPVVVGGGGAGACNNTSPRGTNGNDSTFSSITSTGGGGGGGASPTNSGASGGSGGGGSHTGNGCGGAGNTPPTTPPQGQAGGSAGGSGAPKYGSGGGGGAGAVGGNGAPTGGGNGGNGVTSEISGSPVAYAGGGGGSVDCGSGSGGGSGGTGGGGSSQGAAGPGGTGGCNTGGGGAGASGPGGGPPGAGGCGGTGGSGVVIIRYKYQ